MKETYSQLANEFKSNRSNSTFSKLYVKMKPSLFNYIKGFVKDIDVAEDLTADTFAKVFTQIDKYDPNKGQITTWSFRIAKNDCLSYIKKAKRKTSLEYFNEKGITPTMGGIISQGSHIYEMDDIKTEQDFLNEYNETNDKYNIAINSIDDLSPLYRDIIHDRIINSMNYKDIMFKHDDNIETYRDRFARNEISEAFYNKEYKRALQRVKNRIKRGREMLSKMITEKYQEEYI
jgi:RNA polymerase sigma factor (sigma-70 family)